MINQDNKAVNTANGKEYTINTQTTDIEEYNEFKNLLDASLKNISNEFNEFKITGNGFNETDIFETAEELIRAVVPAQRECNITVREYNNALDIKLNSNVITVEPHLNQEYKTTIEQVGIDTREYINKNLENVNATEVSVPCEDIQLEFKKDYDLRDYQYVVEIKHDAPINYDKILELEDAHISIRDILYIGQDKYPRSNNCCNSSLGFDYYTKFSVTL